MPQLLHLVFGAIGFLALASAAFAYAGWARCIGERGRAAASVVLGLVIVVGFVGGAVLAMSTVGVVLLWAAVLAGWVWLAVASAHVYTWSPHPLAAARSSEEAHR